MLKILRGGALDINTKISKAQIAAQLPNYSITQLLNYTITYLLNYPITIFFQKYLNYSNKLIYLCNIKKGEKIFSNYGKNLLAF